MSSTFSLLKKKFTTFEPCFLVMQKVIQCKEYTQFNLKVITKSVDEFFLGKLKYFGEPLHNLIISLWYKHNEGVSLVSYKTIILIFEVSNANSVIFECILYTKHS